MFLLQQQMRKRLVKAAEQSEIVDVLGIGDEVSRKHNDTGITPCPQDTPCSISKLILSCHSVLCYYVVDNVEQTVNGKHRFELLDQITAAPVG